MNLKRKKNDVASRHIQRLMKAILLSIGLALLPVLGLSQTNRIIDNALLENEPMLNAYSGYNKTYHLVNINGEDYFALHSDSLILQSINYPEISALQRSNESVRIPFTQSEWIIIVLPKTRKNELDETE